MLYGGSNLANVPACPSAEMRFISCPYYLLEFLMGDDMYPDTIDDATLIELKF